MEEMAHTNPFKTPKNSWLKPQNLLLFGILLLAAFLRLYKISDYMTFLGDEGRDALIVYNILHGNLTLLGPTASVGGFFMGPMYYYFMAPFLYLFGYDPVGPAVMVALFGIATVWLLYYVGKQFFNETAGLVAATLYAISPLVIAYSRSSWNPNLMPFFSLLTLFVLYKAIQTNRLLLFMLCGFLYGIALQLHYIELFLGVVIAVYVLLTRSIPVLSLVSSADGIIQEVSLSRKTSRILKDYILILIGFLIGWLPFLAFEIRHGFPNIRSIFNFIFFSGETGQNMKFFANISDVFFRLFGRLLTNFPPPEQVALGAHPDVVLLYIGTLLLGIMSTLPLLFKCFKTFKQKDLEFQKMSLLLIWFVIGIALFGLYKKPIYDYYFEFMFPLPFILVGASLSILYNGVSVSPFPLFYFSPQMFKKIGRTLAIVLVTILLYLNLQAVPFRSSPNRQKDQVKEISEFVLLKTNGKAFNFALITGGNSDHGYRYFFRLAGRDPFEIQNSQVDPQRNSVTDQLLIVCEDPACHPLGNSLWEVAGFGRAEIVGEWNVSVVKVYKLEHYRGR